MDSVSRSRSVIPPAVLLAVPLIANFRVTLHELVDQPTFPNADHVTPWTALAPHLSGHGPTLVVAGGPGRVLTILIAITLGIWVARRLARASGTSGLWACFIALALRSYTESVMTPYYPWAALAFGLVVAARCNRWRFGVAVCLAIATTILAQLRIGWIPWWTIQIAGLTALLVVAAHPESPTPKESTEVGRGGSPATPQKRTASRTAAKSTASAVLNLPRRNAGPGQELAKKRPEFRHPRLLSVLAAIESTPDAWARKMGSAPTGSLGRGRRSSVLCGRC